MSRLSDAAPPPPPPEDDDDSPPPPPADEDTPRKVRQWKQQLVTLSTGYFTINQKLSLGFHVNDAIIVTQTSGDQKGVFFSVTDKKGETHYIQALAPDQRTQWIQSFLDQGASVISQNTNSQESMENNEIKGWVKVLSSTDPTDVVPESMNALKATTSRVLNEKRMAKDSITQEMAITKLQRELAAKDKHSEVSKLKLENSKLVEANTRLTHSVTSLAEKLKKLEGERAKLLEEKSKMRESKRAADTRASFAASDWNELVSGSKSADPAEIEGLRKEVERLVALNSRLTQDMDDASTKYSNLADQSSLLKELRAERDDLAEQLQEAVNSKETLEQSAEEVIEDLTKEKESAEEMLKAAQDDILELKSLLANGEVQAGGAPDSRPSSSTAGGSVVPKDLTSAAELLKGAGGAGLAALVMAGVEYSDLEKRRGSMVLNPSSGLASAAHISGEQTAVIKELEAEKQALVDELCDEKEENTQLRAQLASLNKGGGGKEEDGKEGGGGGEGSSS